MTHSEEQAPDFVEMSPGLSRRTFLKKTMLAGAGLALCSAPGLVRADERVRRSFEVGDSLNRFFSTLRRPTTLLVSGEDDVPEAHIPGPETIRRALGPERRTLSFFHTHTESSLRLTYAAGGQYRRNALNRIDEYLGDFRTGEVHSIDPELLDILWELQSRARGRGTFDVISGYRSPKTNSMLQGRRRHSGVASRSLHMKGRAIDVRFSGMALEELRDHAIDLQAGGVGFYPESDFVHLDTGKFRTWG